jgi:hypothetical protein
MFFFDPLLPEPVFKQRNAGKSRINQLTLFYRIHEHSFVRLGTDTLTFCKLTPFRFPDLLYCKLTFAKE